MNFTDKNSYANCRLSNSFLALLFLSLKLVNLETQKVYDRKGYEVSNSEVFHMYIYFNVRLIGLLNEKIKVSKLGIMEFNCLTCWEFWHWVNCHVTIKPNRF